MSKRIFPLPGTPKFDQIKARVEGGEDYKVIASDIGMTFKGFKDALGGYGLGRRSKEYNGTLPPVYEKLKSASWEEHIRVIKEMDNLVSYHQRVPSEITIEVDTDRPIGLVNTSDWQLGQFGVDYDAFLDDMNFIGEHANLKCIIGGDGYQNIIQTSKMGSSHNQTPISVQKGLYVLTLEKLIDRILAIKTGNHNYWTAMAEGEDWDGELAKRLNLIYLKHYAMIHLKVGDMVYPILTMHQSRFNSSFNLTHTCLQNQRMYFPEARIVVVEHHHQAAIEQYRYAEKECVAIRPGTYAVYDDFAQQYGFFGSHVANPLVVLFPDRDKIVGFKDMRDGVTYMNGL
uniref:Uncharacterized protein n=1 Tax=viral metagenome TaxID=1070528 RepID=A0A6M3KY60_9ZZZZ